MRWDDNWVVLPAIWLRFCSRYGRTFWSYRFHKKLQIRAQLLLHSGNARAFAVSMRDRREQHSRTAATLAAVLRSAHER